MENNETLSFRDFIIDLLIALCFTSLIGGCLLMQYQSAKDTMKEVQSEITTSYGKAYGKIVKVETWVAEPKVIKLSERHTLTLSGERLKVSFEDGRTKELIGFPKNPIITNKNVTLIWAKYDVFLECILTEEVTDGK